MQTITLEDDDVEQLMAILEDNADAVDWKNSVRWTPEAASRIDSLKETIAVQTD